MISALLLIAAPAEAENSFSVELQPGDEEMFSIPHGEIAPATLDFNGAAQLTFEAWVKLFALGSNQVVVAKSSPAGAQTEGSYRFSIGNSNRMELILGHGADSRACLGDSELETNQWHHVAVTFDAGACSFYLDGEPDGTGVNDHSSLIGNSRPFTIGAQEGYPLGSFGAFLDGRIDEVRIWSLVRSQQEIASNRFEVVEPAHDLVGYWRFEDRLFRDATCYWNDLLEHHNGPEPIILSSDVPWAGPSCGSSDTDSDGICDDEDNCLVVSNQTQRDSDRDGYGSACDADYSNDGVAGGPDFLRFAPGYGGSACGVSFDAPLDYDDDGVIGGPDFLFFAPRYGTAPGPSGLGCAGSIPCPTP